MLVDALEVTFKPDDHLRTSCCTHTHTHTHKHRRTCQNPTIASGWPSSSRTSWSLMSSVPGEPRNASLGKIAPPKPKSAPDPPLLLLAANGGDAATLPASSLSRCAFSALNSSMPTRSSKSPLSTPPPSLGGAAAPSAGAGEPITHDGLRVPPVGPAAIARLARGGGAKDKLERAKLVATRNFNAAGHRCWCRLAIATTVCSGPVSRQTHPNHRIYEIAAQYNTIYDDAAELVS